MTDTPKSDADKDTPAQAPPTAPTKRRLPTDDELRALGFKIPPPSGKGYMLVGGIRPPAKLRYTAAQQAIIDALARSLGRAQTEQEIRLALEEAPGSDGGPLELRRGGDQ